MRLRNIKNKEEIISNSEYIVKDYKDYVGKWNTLFNNNNFNSNVSNKEDGLYML